MLARLGTLRWAATLAAVSWLAAQHDGSLRAAEQARVLVNEIGLAHVPFGTPSAWPPTGGKRIAALRTAGPSGPVVAVTQGAAYVLDDTGRPLRRWTYPKKLGWLDAVRFRPDEGWTAVGATDSYGRRLLLVPESDGTPIELRLQGYGARFANVLGDEELEVVVRSRDAILVYDRRGRLLRTIGARDYVDDFWAVDANGAGPSELLVYQFRSKKDGTYLSVLDATGERLRAWHEGAANRYSVCEWPSPTPQIIASRDDAFTVRAASGEVLKQYVVPGSGSFRHVDTGALAGGFRVLLAYNGACPSRLLVFDAGDRLVYDEVFGTYAKLLVPGGEAAVFFVAVDGTIRKYSRVEVPDDSRPAPAPRPGAANVNRLAAAGVSRR